MLQSRRIDWANVTMQDIDCALAGLIRKRRGVRNKGRRKALSSEDTAFLHESGIQVQLLFEGQAIKWAERGPVAIRRKIEKIKTRLANPTKINSYDDILCEKLYEQLHKIERQ